MEKSYEEVIKGSVPQVHIVKSVLDLVSGSGHPTGGGGGGDPGDVGAGGNPTAPSGPGGPGQGDCDW